MNINKNYMIFNNGPIITTKKNIAFDLDGTIIPSIRNENQIIIDSYTLTQLQLLDQFNIYFISNQLKAPKNLIDNIKKLLDILTTNKINVTVFISLKNDEYRKPNVGFSKLINGKLEYFVGDV